MKSLVEHLRIHSPYIVREEYRDRVNATEILDATPEERRRILNSVKATLIEKDHLGDWSPEKDCCW